MPGSPFFDTISISKNNEAARRRDRRRIFTYAEEADDPASAGQAPPTKLAKESELELL